jgi:hypothetical protein
MRSRVVLCALLVVASAGVVLAASAPSRINYQAVLTSGGNPVVGTVNVVFSIYDVSANGVAIWSESRTVSADAQGRINVMLGESTPVTDAAFAGSDRWLGDAVGECAVCVSSGDGGRGEVGDGVW